VRSSCCPKCGTELEAPADPLVAACDMLVLRALELVGKRIVTRARRGRWEQTNLPWYHAHILWQAAPTHIDAALDEPLRHLRLAHQPEFFGMY